MIKTFRIIRQETIRSANEFCVFADDPLVIKLLRRGPDNKDSQVVARFDGSTGNNLLGGNPGRCSDDDENQSLELRTCVEGFVKLLLCMRQKLANFSLFLVVFQA